MSLAVAIKGEVARQIKAALASEPALKGVVVTCNLKDGRLWVNIDSVPFLVHRDDVLTISDSGYRMVVSLMGDNGLTPEAQPVLARVKEIVAAIVDKRIGTYVHYSHLATEEQVKRMRAASVSPAA